VLLPSFAAADVKAAYVNLQSIVDNFCENSLLISDIVTSRTKAVFNATSYLFVSHQLAKSYPQMLESRIVLSYSTAYPGAVARKWQGTSSHSTNEASTTASLSGQSRGLMVYLRSFWSASLILLLNGLAFFPFEIQKMALRFSQPFIYGSGVLLIQAIISNLAYLVLLILLLFGTVTVVGYSYFTARYRSNHSNNSNKIAVAPLDSEIELLQVSREEEKKDVDHSTRPTCNLPTPQANIDSNNEVRPTSSAVSFTTNSAAKSSLVSLSVSNHVVSSIASDYAHISVDITPSNDNVPQRPGSRSRRESLISIDEAEDDELFSIANFSESEVESLQLTDLVHIATNPSQTGRDRTESALTFFTEDSLTEADSAYDNNRYRTFTNFSELSV
jgi:hypothetical protein